MAEAESRTHALVVDAIRHRLLKQGHAPDSVNQLLLETVDVESGSAPCVCSDVQQVMRALCDELENKYRDTFQEIFKGLHISPDTLQRSVDTIMSLLFTDGVNWGRITALFIFVSCLVVECVDKEMPQLVVRIVDWVTAYIDTHLYSWILTNGGWDGLVAFYQVDVKSTWPSFKHLFSYAAGTVGVVTLALLLHRS